VLDAANPLGLSGYNLFYFEYSSNYLVSRYCTGLLDGEEGDDEDELAFLFGFAEDILEQSEAVCEPAAEQPDELEPQRKYNSITNSAIENYVVRDSPVRLDNLFYVYLESNLYLADSTIEDIDGRISKVSDQSTLII